MRKIYEVDPLVCPKYQRAMRVSSIKDLSVIRNINNLSLWKIIRPYPISTISFDKKSSILFMRWCYGLVMHNHLGTAGHILDAQIPGRVSQAWSLYLPQDIPISMGIKRSSRSGWPSSIVWQELCPQEGFPAYPRTITWHF
jgi:hypothetical protein